MQKHFNLVYLVKSFPTSIYLHEHCLCLYHSRRIVFTILGESGQAYLSCARMPGFHFLNRTERTCLLACFDIAENACSEVCEKELPQLLDSQIDRVRTNIETGSMTYRGCQILLPQIVGGPFSAV